MSITDLIEDLIYPGEEYWLETKVVEPGTSDAFGSLVREWRPIKLLDGVIQDRSRDPQSMRGDEELADYRGFFEPTFEIPDNKLIEYRIKHIFPTQGEPFIRFFQIITIDRNLRLDNENNHYELTLQLQKDVA
jgi:hypothetical protein